MTRRKFVCGNWKMHKTAGEAAQLAGELRKLLDRAAAHVAVAPPFTALAAVKQALHGSPIQLFAAPWLGRTGRRAARSATRNRHSWKALPPKMSPIASW